MFLSHISQYHNRGWLSCERVFYLTKKNFNKNISNIELLFQIFQMVFGTHYITSPRWCYPTQDYIEYTNKHYHNIDDEKITYSLCYILHAVGG